ncbi:hypothetical protein BC936DRAFT_137749 [Jimgerdemannia flammicorona]|uniref:Uncharacterized protein n=1 Tax=Jimgerdemannia flammicorona TaxID=994334 RepID=A0A433DMY6_9FUNG|nr:hypothetical protein BC936DRAFT_137749 [Jimgerdemannia flammicorona]
MRWVESSAYKTTTRPLICSGCQLSRWVRLISATGEADVTRVAFTIVWGAAAKCRRLNGLASLLHGLHWTDIQHLAVLLGRPRVAYRWMFEGMTSELRGGPVCARRHSSYSVT